MRGAAPHAECLKNSHATSDPLPVLLRSVPDGQGDRRGDAEPWSEGCQAPSTLSFSTAVPIPLLAETLRTCSRRKGLEPEKRRGLPRRFTLVVGAIMDKVFIDDTWQGVLKCAHCGATIRVHLLKMCGPSYLGDKPIRVQCQCDNIVEARCEFRKFPRVRVHLHGLLRQPGTPKTVGRVTIDSLALGGVGFFVHERLAVHRGEVFVLVFTLDNAEASVLEEDELVHYEDSVESVGTGPGLTPGSSPGDSIGNVALAAMPAMPANPKPPDLSPVVGYYLWGVMQNY